MNNFGLASTASFEQLHQRINTLSARVNRSMQENEKLKKLLEVAEKINPMAVRMWQEKTR